MTSGTGSLGRRERVRAATVEEIKATARRLLVQDGPQGMTLRAIAREMGMTAPGLYRYFPSHEDLWEELCHDTYDDVAVEVERARQAVPVEDAPGRLMAASHAFRNWAARHPQELGLIAGMPLPGMQDLVTAEKLAEHAGGMRFAMVFTSAFADLWAQRPFPVPDEKDMPPGLAVQLRRYRDALAPMVDNVAVLPLGALLLFLQAWVQLYGVVTMEAFGHLRFCLDDVQPFFEAQMRFTAAMLGMPEAHTGSYRMSMDERSSRGRK